MSKKRCGWCGDDKLYKAYHDEEWGVPVYDAQELFERLVLEGMQAGLAWITVLRKREQMRDAFYNFDLERIACSGEQELLTWLNNAGVIRHRGKLEAMIGNAQAVLAMQDFPAFVWQFRPTSSRKHRTAKTVPSASDESHAMSKALKQAGFRFVGPTICYAFMQSVGMVNDHVAGCWRYSVCAEKWDESAQRRPLLADSG